jgi:hypothetical protein
MYGYTPRLAADLAVLGIALMFAAAGIHEHRVRLTAIRADDFGARVRCSVAERKVTIEVEIVGVAAVASITTVAVKNESHPEA